MKKVHLSHYSQHCFKKNRKANYLYQVYLGNGTHHTFQSKRDATAFLNKTSQFLTQRLHELRGIYGYVYFEYNKVWANLDFWRIRDINIEQGYFEIQTEAITRGKIINLNYKAFMHIKTCCDGLLKIIKHLQDISKKNSNTATLYQLDNYIRYVNTIKNDAENFGQVEASQLFHVPIHEILTAKTEYKPILKVV